MLLRNRLSATLLLAATAATAELAQTFNNMTRATLDAMNRGNDRGNSADQQTRQLNIRVTKLENPEQDAA